MRKKNIQLKIQEIAAPLTIILFAVILRLLPHPPNVAPITALALFGGVYLNKKYALIIPLIALLISDMFIGFHDTMIFVYGSFLISGLIGHYLKNHRNILHIATGTVLSSLLFFLITNLGVWIVGSMYPKTVSGLMQSYYMGIPFYRNTLIGDILYTGLFFAGYELLRGYLMRMIVNFNNPGK